MSALVEMSGHEQSRREPVEGTQRALLDAIERELAHLDPGYAEKVLHLAEAHAWLIAPAGHRS